MTRVSMRIPSTMPNITPIITAIISPIGNARLVSWMSDILAFSARNNKKHDETQFSKKRLIFI